MVERGGGEEQEEEEPREAEPEEERDEAAERVEQEPEGARGGRLRPGPAVDIELCQTHLNALERATIVKTINTAKNPGRTGLNGFADRSDRCSQRTRDAGRELAKT